MANETGKRYVCATCGSEMLVTRAGDGVLSCCDQPMHPREAAPPREATPPPQARQAPSEVQRG